MTGAEKRYKYRQLKWAASGEIFPMIRHHFWWLLHNCVSHPVIGIWVAQNTIDFHDWTSQHLNLRKFVVRSPEPDISNRWTWFWHNAIGHIGIGLFPYTAVFKYHDRTAEQMNVKDWL